MNNLEKLTEATIKMLLNEGKFAKPGEYQSSENDNPEEVLKDWYKEGYIKRYQIYPNYSNGLSSAIRLNIANPDTHLQKYGYSSFDTIEEAVNEIKAKHNPLGMEIFDCKEGKDIDFDRTKSVTNKNDDFSQLKNQFKSLLNQKLSLAEIENTIQKIDSDCEFDFESSDVWRCDSIDNDTVTIIGGTTDFHYKNYTSGYITFTFTDNLEGWLLDEDDEITEDEITDSINYDDMLDSLSILTVKEIQFIFYEENDEELNDPITINV